VNECVWRTIYERRNQILTSRSRDSTLAESLSSSIMSDSDSKLSDRTMMRGLIHETEGTGTSSSSEVSCSVEGLYRDELYKVSVVILRDRSRRYR
jgi:hypothetical protein